MASHLRDRHPAPDFAVRVEFDHRRLRTRKRPGSAWCVSERPIVVWAHSHEFLSEQAIERRPEAFATLRRPRGQAGLAVVDAVEPIPREIPVPGVVLDDETVD